MQKGRGPIPGRHLGLALIAPDTSPRGPKVSGGSGGGLGLPATGPASISMPSEPPGHATTHATTTWCRVAGAAWTGTAPNDRPRAISGHSNGRATGPWVCALPQSRALKQLLSRAFAPIQPPQPRPWGEKAFSRYPSAPMAQLGSAWECVRA